MSDRGFESDAAYFDLMAYQSKDQANQTDFHHIADRYRDLAERGLPFDGAGRAEAWRKRAEECRTLADEFKSRACIEQLERLARTYEVMAANYESVAELAAPSLRPRFVDAK